MQCCQVEANYSNSYVRCCQCCQVIGVGRVVKMAKVNRVGKNFAELAKTLQNLDCLMSDQLSDNILSTYNTLESGWWYQLDGAVAGNYVTVDSAIA